MVKSVSHTFLKERRLQSTTPHLWNCRRAGEQRNSLMNTEHASSGQFAVKLGEEAQTLFAC
jgi:hypothetical protein